MATNGKATWLLTIKHPSGQPLFGLLVESEPVEEAQAPQSGPVTATPARTRPATPGSSDGEPKMTEPQRRYLFRLLALQGVEGKAAEEHLKEYFKVKGLRDITKGGASQLIDQMVTDMKEGGADASP